MWCLPWAGWASDTQFRPQLCCLMWNRSNHLPDDSVPVDVCTHYEWMWTLHGCMSLRAMATYEWEHEWIASKVLFEAIHNCVSIFHYSVEHISCFLCGIEVQTKLSACLSKIKCTFFILFLRIAFKMKFVLLQYTCDLHCVGKMSRPVKMSWSVTCPLVWFYLWGIWCCELGCVMSLHPHLLLSLHLLPFSRRRRWICCFLLVCCSSPGLPQACSFWNGSEVYACLLYSVPDKMTYLLTVW